MNLLAKVFIKYALLESFFLYPTWISFCFICKVVINYALHSWEARQREIDESYDLAKTWEQNLTNVS